MNSPRTERKINDSNADRPEQPLNICLLNRSFHRNVGGIETYTCRMAQAFAKRGHKVHIVTLKGDEKFYLNDLGKNIQIHRIEYTALQFPGYWKINNLFPLSYWTYHRAVSQFMKKFIKQHQIDIVETPDMEGYKPIHSQEFPVIVRLHGYNGMLQRFGEEGRKESLSNFLLWQWTRIFFAHADMLLAVSRNYADLIANTFRVEQRKIEVLYLTVDRTIFYPQQKEQNFSMTQKSSIEKSTQRSNTKIQTVLFVGRHDREKGIDVLAQAIPLIVKRYPSVKFIFIGRDTMHPEGGQSYRDVLRQQLQGFPVKFIDSVGQSELAEYFRSCTLSVFPSFVEAGATTVIEAIACGSAVVVSDIATFREYFRNDENAFVVPTGEHIKWADAIAELLQNSSLRDRLGKNALEIVEAFDLEKNIDQSLAFYQETIHRFRTKKTQGVL